MKYDENNIWKKRFEESIFTIKEHYLIKLSDDDEIRKYFGNQLSEILQVDQIKLFNITYEINNYCEFDTILGAIESSKDVVKKLENKDKNHHHRKKDKFYKQIYDTIELLRANGNFKEAQILEKIQYTPILLSKEDQLKEQKEILFYSLVEHCKTSKARASILLKILDFI